ncbi:translational GTPase TypA [Anaerosalibacter bizertensis]|uniref:translational GTPase TypA n=1 Tax=Anaerosalibacter bizertensis TaxID=932217 RepID=UPI001D011F15|nr:translational GTPase TypA [Anaerosalibacter bizertensis]MBV1818253.1 translational GTPase TypA [Bacteroidales bacterium MSK.15.36]MCB5559404.1 translational GTPase TypA [Anaerosalibacter bizertensis]MCG4581714.1 translational GTPase TypA [Anaerosalibacter bizertensis]
MDKKIDTVRNVAIVAHVDHGKTTLVDALLRQSGIFRENQLVKDRIMDSKDIERERGITILSKNTAIHYADTKINIVDTPGHADFGGEVERVLKMVNGVVLLVDAYEGPMPQTKFVLKKALELELPVIVCINKIDREGARPNEVIDEVLDLFIDLGANEEQLECPFIFASAKDGIATSDLNEPKEDMKDLFETIVNYIPAPVGDEEGPLQVLISTIDYSEYVGRIGIGKIERGTINLNQEAVIVNSENGESPKKIKITKIYEFEGLDRVNVEEAKVGSIIAVTGVEGIHIGDTICDLECPEALPFVKISEPTLSMTFSVNNSPFAGEEGEYLTSRHLRNRLYKELQTDVSLRVEDTDSTDAFKVSGRGELHLSVLIETMRREGYEFQVSKPEVLYKYINGKKNEPMESVTIDVPEEFVGIVIEKLGKRKGELTYMAEANGGYSRLVFSIPARGLIGYRSEFMTDTKGNGILNTEFNGYAPYKGDIPTRTQGSLISFEKGEAVAYGLHSAQDRGILFVAPGTRVYEGMVVGSNPKGNDIEVNICKKKQQSNVRASGSDESLRLSPPKIMSLEEALEFIEDDELIEITPENLRIRKKILDNTKRYKSKKRK